MTRAPIPLILDVDTGVDDALALLLAARHPDVRLLAVTCVAGNTDVDQVVRNTLGVLAIAGADEVPVARGAERPLLEEHRDAGHVHGADGIAGVVLPERARGAEPGHAVELLRARILDSPDPVTLVPLGPLTNVALLLRTHPEVQRNLARIVVMGGTASVGNATPVAEFNVWHDPEAAAIVLASEAPVTMYGLDVFLRVALSARDLRALGPEDPGAGLVRALWENRPALGDADTDGMLIGDAGAVCAAIDPDGIRVVRAPVTVVRDGAARGQTMVDRRAHRGESDLRGADWGPPVDVALEVDEARYRRLFLEHACAAVPG